MGDMEALARERNREAARPGSGIENRTHADQPRRDLALQVCLLNDVVEEQALASRFLSRLGRKIPKSLTDIFRIWHGDTTRNDRSPLIFATRFAGNGTDGRAARWKSINLNSTRREGPFGLTIPICLRTLLHLLTARIGPTPPLPTSPEHGGYLRISCRQRRWNTTGEYDAKETSSCNLRRRHKAIASYAL
jgi:hypothetical protein